MLIVPQWVFTLITFNRDVIFSGPFFSMHAVCDALRPMAQLTLSYFLCAGQCSVYVFASWWCFSTKLGETILAYFIFASLLHWKKTKNNKNRWPMWKRLKDYIYIYIFFLQDIEHWSQSLLLLAMYRKQWFFYTNNFLQNIWIHRHLLHGCLMHAHICRWLLCKGILVPTFMPLCDTFLRLFL